MQKGFILILVLAIIFGIFAISNNVVVPVNFIFTEVMLSQAVVIFVSALLGAIITTVFAQIRQMSLKKDIEQLNIENKILQSKIKDKEEHNNFIF